MIRTTDYGVHGREKEKMTLKDRLKGREKHKEEVGGPPTDHIDCSPPNFTFLRTTTDSQELIQPPSYAGDVVPVPEPNATSPRRLSRFRTASNASSKIGNKSEGRFSSILHIRSHSRESNATSINIPTDLPEIRDGKAASEDHEARWEERATILAQQVAATRSRSNTVADPELTVAQSLTDSSAPDDHNENRPGMIRHVSDALSDVKTHRICGVGGTGVDSISRRIFKRRSGSMSLEVRFQTDSIAYLSIPKKKKFADLCSWPPQI